MSPFRCTEFYASTVSLPCYCSQCVHLPVRQCGQSALVAEEQKFEQISHFQPSCVDSLVCPSTVTKTSHFNRHQHHPEAQHRSPVAVSTSSVNQCADTPTVNSTGDVWTLSVVMKQRLRLTEAEMINAVDRKVVLAQLMSGCQVPS